MACQSVKQADRFLLHCPRDNPVLSSAVIIDPINPKRSMDGGYVLVFHFVWGYGVQRNWRNIVSLGKTCIDIIQFKVA